MEDYKAALIDWVQNMDTEAQKQVCIDFGLIDTEAEIEQKRIKEMYVEIEQVMASTIFELKEVETILEVVKNPKNFIK